MFWANLWVDTAKMLPFLFLAYLLIEYIEHRHGERIEALLAGRRALGRSARCPAGLCAACAASRQLRPTSMRPRVITLGTLMAVYLATTMKQIPLAGVHAGLLGHAGRADVHQGGVRCHRWFRAGLCAARHPAQGTAGRYTGHADEVDCHEEHNDEKRATSAPSAQAALRHTLEIFVFIFCVLVWCSASSWKAWDEDVFADLLGHMGFFQPVVAALVGHDPQLRRHACCSPSCMWRWSLTAFSSLVCRVCAPVTGVGLAVLWRANPSWKQNLFITGLTWAAGAFVGVVPCR